ncbi:MAG: FeoA family protein [Pseudomonadota bacterium]|jgi:ferrous iron transport protein A
MYDTLADPISEATAAAPAGELRRLSDLGPGARGVIVEVCAEPHAQAGAVPEDELVRRLLEFGFVEGASLELLHQGLFGGDPIAVRLDDMRVALRRRDAEDVWVRLEPK